MKKFQQGNNVSIPMTRRYPKLSSKVLRRDAEIAKRIISAWDTYNDSDKVLEIFLKEKNNLSDERYWELMRTVWIISGSVLNAQIFRSLMLSKRKEKYYFSTPEEAAQLREYFEPFSVYRATNDENDGGISWTTSLEYAEWYKSKYNKKIIMLRTVTKNEVFAFIDRNNESEMIIL